MIDPQIDEEFAIANLKSQDALALTSSNTVQIDSTADGYGWFVDPTLADLPAPGPELGDDPFLISAGRGRLMPRHDVNPMPGQPGAASSPTSPAQSRRG